MLSDDFLVLPQLHRVMIPNSPIHIRYILLRWVCVTLFHIKKSKNLSALVSISFTKKKKCHKLTTFFLSKTFNTIYLTAVAALLFLYFSLSKTRTKFNTFFVYYEKRTLCLPFHLNSLFIGLLYEVVVVVPILYPKYTLFPRLANWCILMRTHIRICIWVQ